MQGSFLSILVLSLLLAFSKPHHLSLLYLSGSSLTVLGLTSPKIPVP